ncbi:hypothetical protein [Novipirellula sp.]|uniref:hypothetical protein n=1 Tax=Novipirellula sp. TaxID=2795430 RepID=UPI003564DADC
MTLLKNVHKGTASVCYVLSLALIVWSQYAQGQNPKPDPIVTFLSLADEDDNAFKVADAFPFPNKGTADDAMLVAHALMFCAVGNAIAVLFLALVQDLIAVISEIVVAIVRFFRRIGTTAINAIRYCVYRMLIKRKVSKVELDLNPFAIPKTAPPTTLGEGPHAKS